MPQYDSAPPASDTPIYAEMKAEQERRELREEFYGTAWVDVLPKREVVGGGPPMSLHLGPTGRLMQILGNWDWKTMLPRTERFSLDVPGVGEVAGDFIPSRPNDLFLARLKAPKWQPLKELGVAR